MKFINILSGENKLIEVASVNSERYYLLTELFPEIPKNEAVDAMLITVTLNVLRIEQAIEKFLTIRVSMIPDVPDYTGRFYDEDIFISKSYKDETLKLCTTGFDSKVIFLINLYDASTSLDERERPHDVLFTNTHKELNDFISWRAKEN